MQVGGNKKERVMFSARNATRGERVYGGVGPWRRGIHDVVLSGMHARQRHT
jgi:hypothetical protein